MRDVAGVVGKIAAATARDRALIAAKRGDVMTEPGDQTLALRDATAALDAANIGYAVIGGIAVGIHSEVPRATQDVDIAVSTSHQREAVAATLERAGFTVGGSFTHSVNLVHPSGEPVQLAFDPAFDEMIARAERVALSDGTIRIVNKDDLIAMKERAADDPARRRSKSHRDRADIELLRGDVTGPDEGW